jgi:DNA replication protein DnaC
VARRIEEQARREREAECKRLLTAAGIPRRHAEVVAFDGAGWLAKRDKVADLLGQGVIAALVGPRGTGKTQMAVDLIRRQCAAGRSARYVKAMDVFLAVREAFNSDKVTESEQARKFIAPALLVIDEYSVRGESAWEDRLLTHIIDRRYDDRHDTLLISNQTSQEFQTAAGASIVSRMHETGGIIDCTWGSYRTRSEGA